MRAIALAGALIATSAIAQVPFQRIEHAQQEPANWTTYSGNLLGHRSSPLTEITPQNVKDLKVRWVYQYPDPLNETSPLVVDGVMYVTGPSSATALDARTGRELWKWKRPVPSDFRPLGFARTSRGAAVLGDQLFVATLDCYLVALDLKSGAERWHAQVADYKLGYSMTVAPLAIEGKVVTGVSGGEAGIRGFVDAYQATTGQKAWRFWSIPGPSDPEYKTWAGDSAKHGGGSTWVTGAYDPSLKLLYWGIGNPSPDWNGDERRGDNLFTDSFVALDSETGKLRWHFQFTPHDTHDWDASHVPVLVDGVIGGRPRKLVVNANRNGFYYVLDRETGKFVTAQAYGKQTWAKGINAQGRPILLPNSEPSIEGTLLWPNANGLTIWFSPSYSADTGLIYVPVRIKGAVYYKRAMPFKAGTFYPGGGENELPAMEASGEIRAMEVLTGNVKWSFPLLSPAGGGVMSTKGGLVFSGTDEGNFFALDAASGKPLWDIQLGSSVQSNPIAFAVDGHEYVAVSADRVLFVFGL